jgi:hypothetical protein
MEVGQGPNWDCSARKNLPFGDDYKLRSYSLRPFFASPVTFYPLGPNVLQTLFTIYVGIIKYRERESNLVRL